MAEEFLSVFCDKKGTKSQTSVRDFQAILMISAGHICSCVGGPTSSSRTPSGFCGAWRFGCARCQLVSLGSELWSGN